MLTVFPDTWKTSFRAWFTIPSGKSPVTCGLSELRPSGSRDWHTASSIGRSFKTASFPVLLFSRCAQCWGLTALASHLSIASPTFRLLEETLLMEFQAQETSLWEAIFEQRFSSRWLLICMPPLLTQTSVGLCWKTDTSRRSDLSLSLCILSCRRELYRIHLCSLCALSRGSINICWMNKKKILPSGEERGL